MQSFCFHAINDRRKGFSQLGYVLIAVGLVFAFPRSADAVIFTAGESLVDLKVDDLTLGDTAWVNRSAGPSAVGDFTNAGMTSLSLASNIGGVPLSLEVNGVLGNALQSALNTPAAVQGNGTRTVEAWIYANDVVGNQAVLSWGAPFVTSNMSRFSYNDSGDGLLSTWNNDTGWSDPADLIANQWVHVAWTYDGDITRGYINGELKTTVDQPSDLLTADSVVTIGARPDVTSDAFRGYIADIRVHTGVLNDGQVAANFTEGIGEADGLACDFNGDGACNSIDFQTLRDNLFTAGNVTQGDYDFDGFIDLADYRAFKDDPNTVLGTGSSSSLAAQVPEPTSLACLTILGALLGATSFRGQDRH